MTAEDAAREWLAGYHRRARNIERTGSTCENLSADGEWGAAQQLHRDAERFVQTTALLAEVDDLRAELLGRGER